MSDKGHCCHLLKEISDYIDGELPAEICADLEKHLQECNNCRIVVNSMRMTIELYQDSAAVDTLPADVKERLFYRLNLESFLLIPGEKKE